jgi:hypothetical protein
VIGVPPVVVPGSSTVHLLEPPSRFVLRAGMGPFGAAVVEFRVTALAPDRSRIEISEQFVAGPAGWSWRWVRPLAATLVWGRNVVSLQALRSRIEGTEGSRIEGSGADRGHGGPTQADGT